MKKRKNIGITTGKFKDIFNKLHSLFINRESEYVDYGKSPGYTIFTNRGNCIMGHIFIKKTDSKEQIAFKMIHNIINICEKENISIEDTMANINANLKNNNLI
jgi:hypothetical protein